MDDMGEVRKNYDLLVKPYADVLFRELDFKPFDREILDSFAKYVGRGIVCDVGCGPGQVTAYLASRGCNVVGLDISPLMLSVARTLNPTLRFLEGDMSRMPFEGKSLDGIVAFYAIVNNRVDSLAHVFREMERVLKPGQPLLIAFHIGDLIIAPTRMWDVPVSLTFQLFETNTIVKMLCDAGFTIDKAIEREPYADSIEHQSRRAFVRATKTNIPH